jgi:hypothetical protein
MISVQLRAVACFAVLLLLSVSANSATYDGRWSVLVITDKGTCDVYRWSISVLNGRVVSMEENIARPSGRISRKGSVNLTFRRGRDVLQARGRIGRNYGSGSWKASGRNCAGRWRAERL